jgi:hypothetical protein
MKTKIAKKSNFQIAVERYLLESFENISHIKSIGNG